MVLLDQVLKPRRAEELAFIIRRLGKAVGMEHQNVSGLERDSPFIVGDILKNAQGKSR